MAWYESRVWCLVFFIFLNLLLLLIIHISINQCFYDIFSLIIVHLMINNCSYFYFCCVIPSAPLVEKTKKIRRNSLISLNYFFFFYIYFIHTNAQHSSVFTTKSSCGANGSFAYVLHRWDRPRFKSPSSQSPNLPLQFEKERIFVF